MKWYNYLFDKLGHRRLMTRQEFWNQVRSDVTRGDLRVLPKRQHELLLDIAALANLTTEPFSRDDQHFQSRMEAVERLRKAVLRYKMLEQDENPSPSTNTREVHLMEIPGT